MTIWLLINTTIALLVLLFLKLQDDAPHRLRFHCCIAAAGAWLVPWNLLPVLVPPALTAQLAVETSGVPLLLKAPVLIEAGSAQSGPDMRQLVSAVLSLSTFIGALLFLRELRLHAVLMRKLAAASRELPDTALPCELREKLQARFRTLPPIRIQNILPGAIGTGTRNPTIWINDWLLEDEGLEAALHHELVHLRQHDNSWLWFLTLTERLLWWNPLVRLLSRHARQAQELSCDALCQYDLPGYRSILGKLVIDLADWKIMNRSTPQSLYSSIVKDANFNVERIRQLQRRLEMKTGHKLGAGLLIVGVLLVGSSPLVLSQNSTITTGNEATPGSENQDPQVSQAQDQAEMDAKMAEVEARFGAPETEWGERERRIRVGLEVYADRLERRFDELRSTNEQLETRVQELEQQLANLE